MFMENDFHLTDDVLHFKYIKAHKGFDCIYFKNKRELVTFHSRDGFFPLIFANIKGSTGNALIGYIYPGMMYDKIEYWQKQPYEEVVGKFGKERTDLLLEIKLNDNPIITFYYPKKI